MWLVVKLTGSGTAVGLVAALQFLPSSSSARWAACSRTA